MCRLIGSLTPLFLLCTLTGCYTRLRAPEPSRSDAPVPPAVQEHLPPLPDRLHGSLYSGLLPARFYDPWDALPYHTYYNPWTGRLTFPSSYDLIRTSHGWYLRIGNLFYNPHPNRWTNRVLPIAPRPRIRRLAGELHPEDLNPVAPRPRIRRRGFGPEISSASAVRGQNAVTSPKESKPSEGKQPEKKKKPSEEEKREKKRKKNRRRGGMN